MVDSPTASLQGPSTTAACGQNSPLPPNLRTPHPTQSHTQTRPSNRNSPHMVGVLEGGVPADRLRLGTKEAHGEEAVEGVKLGTQRAGDLLFLRAEQAVEACK